MVFKQTQMFVTEMVKHQTHTNVCGRDGDKSRALQQCLHLDSPHLQVVATETVGTIFIGASSLATALLEQGINVNGAGKLQWIFTDSISLDSSFTFNYPRGIIAVVPASRYIVEFEDHWVS